MVNPIFFSGISLNTPIRDPFGSTWPDHLSKADDGPVKELIQVATSSQSFCQPRAACRHSLITAASIPAPANFALDL